jgi:hypothetical protein
VCLFIFENYNFSSWIIIKINQIIVLIILIVVSGFIVGWCLIDCFDLFNYIYCDGVDSVETSNSNINSSNNNIDSSNNNNSSNSSNSSNNSCKDELVCTIKKEDVIVTSKEVMESNLGVVK